MSGRTAAAFRFPGWRIPTNIDVARGGGASPSAVGTRAAPTDDIDHRAPAPSIAEAAPPLSAPPAPGTDLVGVAFRGSEATPTGNSGGGGGSARTRAFAAPAGSSAGNEQRHLALLEDERDRCAGCGEPAPEWPAGWVFGSHRAWCPACKSNVRVLPTPAP